MVKIAKGAATTEAINAVVEYVKTGKELPADVVVSADLYAFINAFNSAKENKGGVINDVTSALTGAATTVTGFVKNAVTNIATPSDKERLENIEKRLEKLETSVGISPE